MFEYKCRYIYDRLITLWSIYGQGHHIEILNVSYAAHKLK